MTEKKFFNFLLFLLLIVAGNKSEATLPRPDHVVVCVLENHAYVQVIDSTVAPFIYTLAMQSADLRQFYALTHPSQPNYLMLFSGYNQGEVTDNLPPITPWQTPNLGASLLQNGFTFKGYSEDLPAIGSTVFASGSYARKHSPWINWQGNGLNQIPDSFNLPFSYFQLTSMIYLIFVLSYQIRTMTCTMV